MNIVTKPTVKLVSKQVFIDDPDHPIPADGNHAERLGAFAAKGCYESWGAGPSSRSCLDNQRAVVESYHGSVLEHVVFGFRFEGITRALSLELNRHRAGMSISQRSTRYVKEEDSSIVLEPYFARLYEAYQQDKLSLSYKEATLLHEHINSAERDIASYERQVNMLLDLNPNNLTGFDLRKWARGKARNSLPHSLETTGVWTANVRLWRHFIETRSERHAEEEIRSLANAVFNELRTLAPVYFEDYTPVLVGHFYEYQTKYRKV